MLWLKEANLSDWEKEYLFTREIPAEESSYVNEWHGISREDFVPVALKAMLDSSRGENLPEGYVPETFLYLWDGDEIRGQFRIRHHLTEALRSGAGHIGYYIHPEYRGRGYATQGLKLALHWCRDVVAEKEIYLRVNRDNPASLQVMLKNGGYIAGEDEHKYYVRIPERKGETMKVILASDLGASVRVNGVWTAHALRKENGFLDRVLALWKQNARVLIISADPDDYVRNDSVHNCLSQALPMSGLSVSAVVNCDNRNLEAAENLDNVDVVILAGGHVPTQNRFMAQLGLREKLKVYKGLVMGWSAGSMNCADRVYAGPELEGEALDPDFQRWIPGLGLTNINIFPHFLSLKDDWLDGMRLIEDITFADSMGHDILAINDGTYILIDEGEATLYGEAYLIRDGIRRQICRDGQSLVL